MVRQLQYFYCGERYAAVALNGNPDFDALIKAYGGEYFLAEDEAALDGALDKLLASPGLALLEARVAWQENVLPMVLAGNSLHQMAGID